MRRWMRHAIVCAATMAAGLSGTTLQAQGWQRLPNGELGYRTDYTSTGFFACNQWFITRGACRVNGSSVTLTNAGNSLTLTYHGYSTSVLATAHSKTTPIGYIEKSFTGSGPFIFPRTRTPNAYYVNFWIAVSTVTPVMSSGIWNGGYLLGQNGLKAVNLSAHSKFLLPVSPPPSPATYNGLASYDFTNPDVTLDNQRMYFDANVSITPEPATIVLLGTGLVGTFGAWRRRRGTRTSDRSA
ncbi:MAG: PEP-CTERM sorting domain-containing protein [Gemmatimonadaceae bacterium]|nr:PEP-CTERM sorting domain-containing protein [Gemmatimonadaceae bacterium]